MSKKDYKRKRSRALTKQRKELHNPQVQKMTQGINHNTLSGKKVKKEL